MSRYWSALTRALTPYVPGEQPRIDNLIKLNTNENPYGPSPRVLAAIRDAASDTLRLYPDPNAGALKSTLAAYHGVDANQVFVGNGSDEVLAHAFIGLLKHERPLWMPDISYSFYPVYCGLYDITHCLVPLASDFSIRPEDYLPRGNERAGAIVFANPNAPTGRLLAPGAVENIVAANLDAVVLVDEAYVDFGGHNDNGNSDGNSVLSLIGRYPNLLVVRTFSKSRALAGLRVGYAIGNAELIAGLERIKNSFNSYPLDRLTLAGAIASVEDDEHFRASCRKVIASRETLSARLRELGFEVLPSAANFIFARAPLHDAATLAATLRQHAIIVRHFRTPRIEQFLRITVGTDEACAHLVDVLADEMRPKDLSRPTGHTS
ncbi:MAG: histidinol-phosphate transaminase [Azoarcus sp.]|jgi:histidinol-phosphate aminotransferase|nr:histidinol-phosphate transaminase [Azoarcus sp.]